MNISPTYQHDFAKWLQYQHAYKLTTCCPAVHEEKHEVVPENSKMMIKANSVQCENKFKNQGIEHHILRITYGFCPPHARIRPCMAL